MNKVYSLFCRAGAVVGLAALAVLPTTTVSAQVTLVTLRGAMASNDFIDWGPLGGDGTVLPNAFTLNSHGGCPWYSERASNVNF